MLQTSEEFFTAEQNFTPGQTLEEQLLELTGLNKPTVCLLVTCEKSKRKKIFEYIL